MAQAPPSAASKLAYTGLKQKYDKYHRSIQKSVHVCCSTQANGGLNVSIAAFFLAIIFG